MNNKKIDVIVIGTGGLAREFTNYFSEQVNVIGYSTKNPEDFEKYGLHGQLFPPELKIENMPCKNLVIAVGSPQVKRIIHEKFKQKGFIFPTLKHKTSVVSDLAFLGEGVIISPLSIVGPKANLEKCVYINYQVGVGHDACIGAYTQINTGAQVAGCTIVEGDTLIGSNATILENSFIGKNITVGSGAIVLGKKSKVGTITPPFSKYLPF